MSQSSHRDTYLSTGTEAVISKSGQVKKRFKNYETTLVSKSKQKVLVFPPEESATEALDNLSMLDSVSEILEQGPVTIRKTPVRKSVVIIGAIIVITFSWSMFSLFFSHGQDSNLTIANSEIAKTTNTSAKLSKDIGGKNKLTTLKLTADLLLEEQEWSNENIQFFLEKWNNLNETETANVMSSSWMQLFTFNLKKQIKQYHNSQLSASTTIGGNSQSLLTLGLVTGVLDQTGNFSEPTSGKSKYSQLIDDLTKEINQAEHRSKNVKNTKESEATMYAKLKNKYGSKQQSEIVSPSTANNTKQVVKLTKPAVNGTSVSNNIVDMEIKNLLSNYKRAYKNGDMAMIANIFGATDELPISNKQLTSSFKTIFENTENRSIIFYGSNWKITGQTAVMHSKFNSSVDFKGNKGTQYTVADIEMVLRKTAGKLIISRLNILNKNVNVIAPKILKNKNINSSSASRLAFPTAAELQDITTQLVTSYETGDLEQFLSLFSNEVKTNDRIDLAGVKKDYAKLFSSSSDRQMFIQNLRWTNGNIGSKGTGDLEVIILSDEGNMVYSMTGKIQIVAQKIDRKTLITHLYHIEREK